MVVFIQHMLSAVSLLYAERQKNIEMPDTEEWIVKMAAVAKMAVILTCLLGREQLL